ncbi:MAG: DNA polymerase III subunit delta [Pseudomonadota bacterium]
MKKRFDQYIHFPDASVQSVLLYGTNESYLQFCTKSICDAHKKTQESIVVEKHSQNRLLEQPHLLKNQGDLFSKAAHLKIIIVTEATDRSVKLIEAVLEKDTTVQLIFSCLVGSSLRKLKTLHETSKRAAFVGCYLGTPEEKRHYLRALTAQHSVRFAPDLKHYIFANFEHYSADLAENFYKLSLYQQKDDSELTTDDWHACCHSFVEGQVGELALAIADGNPLLVVKALEEAQQSGIEDMHILRGVLLHFNKLLQLKAEIAKGKSIHEAVTQARPLIFFKNQPRYKTHLQKWTTTKMVQATARLQQVELNLKKGLQGVSAATHQLCLELCR